MSTFRWLQARCENLPVESAQMQIGFAAEDPAVALRI